MQVILDMTAAIEKLREELPEDEQIIMSEPQNEAEEEEDGHVYLEEPIPVRELTPRMYDEEKSFEINKLKKKKIKLKKKIETDLRKSVQVKQQ